MDTEKKRRWKIAVSGPRIRAQSFDYQGPLQETIQYAAWNLWTNLRVKTGIGRAEITDENGFLKATVKIESHGA